MSIEQFWNSTDIEVHAFKKAYFNRTSRSSWMQGLYNYQAQSIALSNAFAKKKSDRLEYPKEPMLFDKSILENDNSLSKEQLELKRDEEFRQKMLGCL